MRVIAVWGHTLPAVTRSLSQPFDTGWKCAQGIALPMCTGHHYNNHNDDDDNINNKNNNNDCISRAPVHV